MLTPGGDVDVHRRNTDSSETNCIPTSVTITLFYMLTKRVKCLNLKYNRYFYFLLAKGIFSMVMSYTSGVGGRLPVYVVWPMMARVHCHYVSVIYDNG